MKRILIIVSIIFISLFIVSCKPKDEPINTEGSLTAGSWGSRGPYPDILLKVDKHRFSYNEEIKLNFYASQYYFNDDGTFTHFKNIYNPSIHSSINPLTKMEIRFVINPSYEAEENTFIYLSDYIDVSYNGSYKTNFDVILDESSNLAYPNYAYIDNIKYLATPQEEHPIVVAIEPKMIEKGWVNSIYMETRFTFKDFFNFDDPIYREIFPGPNRFFDRKDTDKYYYMSCHVISFFSLKTYLYFSPRTEYPMFYTKEMDTLKSYEKFELTRNLPNN